jgi:putative ABC transport system permease protein
MILNYLKVAFRTILKNRVYSLISIAGLAIGMACCLLIFLWVQDELSFDNFHENGDRLYQVVTQYDDIGWTLATPWAIAPILNRDFPEIERAARFNEQYVLIQYEDRTFYESVGFVDPDFLKMFSFPIIKGDPATALNAPESVLISERTARKYFKDDNPIGKVITVNNQFNLTVTGILKNVPSNSSLEYEMLMPIEILGVERLNSWSWETTSFVMLNDNASVDLLREKIAGTIHKYDLRGGLTDRSIISDLQHVSRIHLYSLNGTGPILYVYLFSAIAIIVLIVACINFINLITAKASVRGKEIGVRKVVGAGRNNIITQYLGETLLIAIIAFGMSLILAEMLLPGFNTITEKQLSLNYIDNSGILISSILIVLLTTLIAGSYPAFILASFRPIQTLKGSFSGGFKKSSIRRTLVIVQFTVSIILIVMTITIGKQLSYIQNKYLGFNREQVLAMPLNDDARNTLEALKHQLLLNPGIVFVTSATGAPNNIGSINPVYWEGRGLDEAEMINYVSVDFDYIDTFEIEIIDGRNFSEDLPTDANNYIVNEAAVDYMKLDSPVGKLFSIWKNEGRIIGVVRNFHFHSLHNEIVPMVMTLTPYVPHNTIFIRIVPQNVNTTIASIENLWNAMVPGHPFQYEFLDDNFRRQYHDEARIKSLFQHFSAMVIFISCIGLFGLTAIIAQYRTKEIGIRKVVGATVFDIIGLMIKDFSKWMVIAATVAIPIAYYLVHKWLENFAYRTGISWIIFAGVGLSVFFIALLTIGFQAIRSAMANPVESLRYE